MKLRFANRPSRRPRSLLFCGVLLAVAGLDLHAATPLKPHDPLTQDDATGLVRTLTPTGVIDNSNPFFQSLGSNGRSCGSCHRPENAWSISPDALQARFLRSTGTDPVFRTVDGSNAPNANVSTFAAKRAAYSMLLNKGLIRIGISVPATAEFTLDSVDDPYHYANAADVSMFRRPLPSANLRFITAAMWDGRETHKPFLPPMDAGANGDDLTQSLSSQAVDAVLTHAQGAAAPTPDQVKQIVELEMSLTTAQVFDRFAGWLNTDDALGGPRALANQQFYVGVNDVLGADPAGAAFDPVATRLFSAWDKDSNAQRAAIARGEKLFGSKPIAITGVGGLNDALNMPIIAGTCTTCHDSPNIGNHSVALPIDIGLTDASRRTPDMPLYTLRNKTTGDTRQTTDPGRAMITGKWADIGKFKGPILRSLAARPPYFHNGSAATLADAVDFYNTRFNIGISAQEKSDLVAFLSAL
jgi:cytochrome c peroxidase